MQSAARGIAKKTTAILSVLAVLLAAAGFTLWLDASTNTTTPSISTTTPTSTATSSSPTMIATTSTTTCQGCPPPTWQATFMITLNYTGPWRMSYYGYHGSLPFSGPAWSADLSGNYTGKSFRGTSQSVYNTTLYAPGGIDLSLCARAWKLDSSSSILTLSLGPSNSTSLPYGNVTVCVEEIHPPLT